VPKGPVLDEHFIIVPKKHIAHSLELNDQQEEELHNLKQKVFNFITTEKHMDYIFFERNMPFNFAKAAHMNLQIIALPSETDLDERVRGLLNGFGRS
jgi:diadenosine tetraphosphate (Ap4A) HIT family hydrolase